MFRSQTVLYLLAAVAILLLPAGCQKAGAPRGASTSPPVGMPATTAPASQPASGAPATASTPAEQPVAPEKNPPGDIPDSQVFITYTSTAGKYALEAPEGWARSEHGADVKFTDKFDGEQVTLSQSSTSPTVSSVGQAQVLALQQTGHAVKIQGVETKAMPHGVTTVCVTYTSNSDLDAVTGKQVRLDNVAYYYYRPGTLATLTVWAPSGADNADQWKRISESFRWR